MRGTYEESEKPLKSLAKHVRDLRKLWYLEHEQNRRLTTFIQNNTTCKADIRSIRGVSNHSRVDCSDFLNISGISTDFNASRPVKAVEVASAFSSKLSFAVLKVTRKSFSAIVEKSCRSLHRLRGKMTSTARLSQHLALLHWRSQAHTASIVYCVNTDLRYIRSLDRLDVLVACKVREIVKKTFAQLNMQDTRGKRLATLFDRMNLREKWQNMKSWSADKKTMEKALKLLSQSWTRKFFHKLQFLLRIEHTFLAVAKSQRKLLDFQKYHTFGLLVGLANAKKPESLESTSLAFSAPCSSCSPEKTQKTRIAGLAAATTVGLILSKGINRVQSSFFRLLRKSPIFPILVLDRLVWRLSSRVTNRKNDAMDTLKSVFSYEKRKMKAKTMFEKLEIIHFAAGIKQKQTGWKRLIEFHERDIVRKQGIEVLVGTLLTAQTRKELKSGLDSLTANSAGMKKRAKGLFSIANVLRNRQISCFYAILHGKTFKKTTFRGTIRLMTVLERHSFILMQNSFQKLQNPPSFLKLVKALWTWKYSKEIRMLQVQKGLDNVMHILHRLRQETVLSALFTLKGAVSASKCVASGMKLLKKSIFKRVKDVFTTINDYKKNAVLESNIICLTYALESASLSLHQVNVQLSFRTIAKYQGFPWKVELETAKRASFLTNLAQLLEFRIETVVRKSWGNLHLHAFEGNLTQRSRASHLFCLFFHRKETNMKKYAFKQITQISIAQKQTLWSLFSVLERALYRNQFLTITTLRHRSEIAHVTSMQKRHSSQQYGVKLLFSLLRTSVSQVKSLSFNQVKTFSVSHNCNVTYRASTYMSSSLGLVRSRPVPRLSTKGLSSPHQVMSQSIGVGGYQFPPQSPDFGSAYIHSASPLRTLPTNFL